VFEASALMLEAKSRPSLQDLFGLFGGAMHQAFEDDDVVVETSLRSKAEKQDVDEIYAGSN